MRTVRSVLLIVMVVFAAAAAVSAADTITDRGLSSTDVVLDKPASTLPAPLPDPDVILQGGDTCATATVIGSLPYTDAGTTVGYTNDYDEVCDYTGSTAPDVVYSFTPAADTAIDLTLCTGTTDYDTKLYIYDDTCASPFVACNDDFCSDPFLYVSELTGVPLTGGQTYYIVVDGYGTGAGEYTLDITEGLPPPPPPECPPDNTLYGQLIDMPDDAWSAGTSGLTSSFEYSIYENFTSDLFGITDFHWWGLSLFWTGAGFADCDPTGLTFDLTFYDDAAGQPGAEICSFPGLAPTAVDAGLLYSGYPLYSWDVTGLAPTCAPTGAAWVSLQSQPNAADCTLMWISGTGGDGDSLQLDAGTGLYTNTLYDRGMCITGDIVPVELQSFDIE